MTNAEIPSAPRAPRWARILVYALLLAIAVASIWLIDVGGGRGPQNASTAPATQP